MAILARNGLFISLVFHMLLVFQLIRYLFPQYEGFNLSGILSRHLVLRDVAGLGRSVDLLAIVVCSVK